MVPTLHVQLHLHVADRWDGRRVQRVASWCGHCTVEAARLLGSSFDRKHVPAVLFWDIPYTQARRGVILHRRPSRAQQRVPCVGVVSDVLPFWLPLGASRVPPLSMVASAHGQASNPTWAQGVMMILSVNAVSSSTVRTAGTAGPGVPQTGAGFTSTLLSPFGSKCGIRHSSP